MGVAAQVVSVLSREREDRPSNAVPAHRGHADNAPMRRALRSFGFRECGTITVANGTQRVAYDWLKEPLDGGAPASPTTR